jgi:flagellar basal body rod protein FlgB
MVKSLFGPQTTIGALRSSLTAAATRARGLTSRIVNAQEASSQQGTFADALGALRQRSQADIEADMAALADTQLRHEAATRLLSGQYTALRTAMRRDG